MVNVSKHLKAGNDCRSATYIEFRRLNVYIGSECPVLNENQLRLYGMRFCPFVQRAKLVLEAKKIPYVTILSSPTNKTFVAKLNIVSRIDTKRSILILSTSLNGI
jgi:hypothetical protein